MCRNPAITGGTESSSAGISVLSASAEKAEGNLKELYINKKLYKELEHPGLSARTIHRIRKQGLETIRKWYLSKEFAGTEIQ